jgi:hypothetical protein
MGKKLRHGRKEAFIQGTHYLIALKTRGKNFQSRDN